MHEQQPAHCGQRPVAVLLHRSSVGAGILCSMVPGRSLNLTQASLHICQTESPEPNSPPPSPNTRSYLTHAIAVSAELQLHLWLSRLGMSAVEARANVFWGCEMPQASAAKKDPERFWSGRFGDSFSSGALLGLRSCQEGEGDLTTEHASNFSPKGEQTGAN